MRDIILVVTLCLVKLPRGCIKDLGLREVGEQESE